MPLHLVPGDAGVPEPRHAGPPACWTVVRLGRERPVYVPDASWAVQVRILRFFLPKIWQRSLCAALLLLPRVSGVHCSAADRSAAAEELRAALPADIAGAVQYVAYAVGSPGPLRKCVAVWVGERGEPLAVTKVAVAATGDAGVMNEAAALESLATVTALGDAIPRLVATGTLRTGRRFVTTKAMTGGRYSRSFGEKHRRFLATMAENNQKTVAPYSDLPGLRLARAALDSGKFANDQRGLRVANAALTRARELLDGVRGPVTLSHRDFAPWNIRVTDTALQVYDWEVARADDNPVNDVLHFGLIQDAVLRGRVRSKTLRTAMERAQEFVASTFGEHDWTESIMKGLLLSYLLDVLAQYAFADDGLRSSHPVIRAYVGLLEDLCASGNDA